MKKYHILLVYALVAHFSYSQNLLSQQQIDRKFTLALDLFDHNQFGAARNEFSEYLSLSSDRDVKRIDAEYYLAVCALNLYHGDGEQLIENFIRENPKHPKSVTANYDLANFYYIEKNYKKAVAFYGKVNFSTLTDEQQNLGRFRWGYSLFSQRLLKESLEQFNKIKTAGGTYGPAASYYAGFVEYSLSDFSNALTDLQRAEQNQSYSKVVPYLIANVYYRQGNYEALLGYATKVSAMEGINNKEEISLLAAEAYYKKKDYKNALAGYNDYLEGRTEKADKGVLLRAGFSAFSVNDDVTAIKYLRNSVGTSDSIGFYSSYYLGALYLKQNQKPLAATAFDVARKYKTDPRLVEESTFQFAKVSYDLGKPDLAITEFESILSTFPNSIHTDEIKELLSQAYVNASNFNKAIEYIESLPKRSPAVDRAFQKATLLKGMELFNKEDYGAAVDFFEKSLRFPVDPQYVAEASFWNGEAYSIGRKYDQAAENYLRIVGMANTVPVDLLVNTRYGLGYAYFNQKQYDKALFNFKEFVNKSSRNQNNLSDGTLRLADCYFVTKAYPDALTTYRKVFNMKSADLDYAHMQAGVILGIQQNYKEALEELDHVLRNYTQSRFLDEVLFTKGQLDFEQGNYSPAVDNYSKLLQQFPSSRFAPYAYTRRAASFFNLKEYNKTAQDYISAIESYPSHPATHDILLPLQESLNLAGRPEDFDKYLNQFKNANPDSKGIETVEFETAKNLYFNQDYSRAVKSLTSYAKSYPSSPRVGEAKYYLAESYYRLKDTNNALPVYLELAEEKGFLFANKVVGRLAELEFKLGHYERAITYFHQLSRLAGNKKDQYNAWAGLMESHYLLAQYDSASAYAEIIIQRGAVNAGAANKASLYLGKSAMGKGDYELAKDEFLNTLNAAQDEYGAEAKYLLGEIQFLNKEYKQCYETLISLNSDFAAYPEWVGKSFLLLSDYFMAIGDSFQAKATLNSLIEKFPDESIKLIAREKLKKISDEELAKQKQVKTDSIDN